MYLCDGRFWQRGYIQTDKRWCGAPAVWADRWCKGDALFPQRVRLDWPGGEEEKGR